MNGAWSTTFSVAGFATAVALGCTTGAIRNALRPAPKRYYPPPSYDWDDDGYEDQVSEEQWILEGMWYGSLLGFAVNLSWPILLVGGIPLGAIYTGARFLQKRQSFVKEKN